MPEKLPVSDRAEESTRDKRKAIVTAAREIFALQGYEATTIAEIASAADVAVGTVYLYFHNKRELYVAASSSLYEEIAAALVRPEIFEMPVEQAARAMIETAFQICRTNNKFMRLFQISLQSPQEILMHQKGNYQIVHVINTYLSRSVERGDFQPFDTEMYAKILFNLVDSILYECFCIDGGEREEHYRERTIEVVQRIFFGPPLRG